MLIDSGSLPDHGIKTMSELTTMRSWNSVLFGPLMAFWVFSIHFIGIFPSRRSLIILLRISFEILQWELIGYHFQTELGKLGETNRKRVILVLEFMSFPKFKWAPMLYSGEINKSILKNFNFLLIFGFMVSFNRLFFWDSLRNLISLFSCH